MCTIYIYIYGIYNVHITCLSKVYTIKLNDFDIKVPINVYKVYVKLN